VLVLVGLLSIGFAVDLSTLRQRPFAWLVGLAEIHLGRVVLVQLAILIGFVLLTWRGHEPQRFLLAFAALKTMADLGNVFSRALGVERLEIETPSPWFAAMMNRLGAKSSGEDFATDWQRQREEQRALAAEDEQVMKDGRFPRARRGRHARR
jgi:hypothetical protein